jgi:hypothetical protein
MFGIAVGLYGGGATVKHQFKETMAIKNSLSCSGSQNKRVLAWYESVASMVAAFLSCDELTERVGFLSGIPPLLQDIGREL